ncbi:MAG: 4-(cytidine 5'-diphospho)-2-C-methyl-D-erythritol kinase [Verrucomicrobiales bacterium]
MPSLTLAAHAKTNLSLWVLGKRDDGFHEVRTRMTPLSLCDLLHIQTLPKGRGLELVVEGADWTPKPGEENLVAKAARVFREETNRAVDVRIILTKKIPSGAGLGGGSSDAAATLRGLDHLLGTNLGEETLLALAAAIGSDVPFFIHGKPCDCSGRGECITPVADDWELPVVLLKPDFGVSTPEAYGRWKDAPEIPGVLYAPQLCPWGEMENDLERPVFAKYPVLALMKMWLLEQQECHAALMSGSGSTVLAILATQHGGENLAMRAKEEFGPTLWTHVGQTICVTPRP